MRLSTLRLLAISGLFLGFTACQDDVADGQFVVIKNTTAIDAINGVRENVDIILSGGVITDIKTATDNATLKGNIEIINGEGRFVIPGLWDAHVHLSYNEQIGHEVFYPLSIAHGITAMRDTGGHLEKLEAARDAAQTDPTQPDLFVSGPLLDGMRRVYDGSSAGFPDLSVGLETAEEARAYVDVLAEAGVSFVKAYEMLEPDVFAAIGDQAEKRGLPVSSHIPLSMSAEEAVRAGADDMQHLRNLELSCAGNAQDLAAIRKDMIVNEKELLPSALRSKIHLDQRRIALPNQDSEKCAALIRLLAAEDVYQTPTLTITRFLVRRLFLDDEFRATFDLMPSSIGEGWKTRSSALADMTTSEIAASHDEWVINMIPKLAEANVPIMAGTDAPIAFLTPGASLHEEMIMLGEAGLSEMEVLRSATYEPARFLNLETERGTLEKGMKADLVILRADPLQDLQNIKSIETVIKNGYVLNRVELNRRLSAASKL